MVKRMIMLLTNTDGYGKDCYGTEVMVNSAHIVSITEHIYAEDELPKDSNEHIDCFVELITGRIIPCVFPKYKDICDDLEVILDRKLS